MFVVGLPEGEYQCAIREGLDLSLPARRVLVGRQTQLIGRTIRRVIGTREELLSMRQWFARAGYQASVEAIDRGLGSSSGP